MKHTFIKYFSCSFGPYGVFQEDRFCIDKKTHVYRRDMPRLGPEGTFVDLTAADIEALGTHVISPCDTKACTRFTKVEIKEPLPLDAIIEAATKEEIPRNEQGLWDYVS